MRRIRLAALCAVAVALLTALTMATAHAAPRVDTAPSASYVMSNPCGSGSYCTITVTIQSNPSNYNTRAWMNCTGSGTNYGGWHTSGTSTAGCGIGGGSGQLAGIQYDKTHKYVLDCWIVSDPRTGNCE